MKKFIIGIMLFVFPFALSAQVDKAVFKKQVKENKFGVEIETNIFMEDAFNYADSLNKEIVFVAAVKDSLEVKVSVLEDLNNKLEQESEDQTKEILALKARLEEIIKIASKD